jgi:hypothetical protein
MARLYGALTLVVMTLLREWKATAVLLIALYVAIAVVHFLDRSEISLCIGFLGCRRWWISPTGR